MLPSRPNSEGIIPDMLLFERSTTRRELIPPISGGSGPVRPKPGDSASSSLRLKEPTLETVSVSPKEISNSSKFVRNPISLGIDPVSALPEKSMDVSVVKRPISRGMVPARFSEGRESVEMVSLEHPTPCQEQ